MYSKIESKDISLFFEKNNLIPTIIQDYHTKEVLMLAYMNNESFNLTISTGKTWFYSRSRQKLWNKGESSGNIQKVIEGYIDCDNDTLLFLVEQVGFACHTGERSCFYTKLYSNKECNKNV